MRTGGDDPWSILGVGRAASEGEIRRAYARQLREARPDEAPERFQRLVEARNYALEIAARKQASPLDQVSPVEQTSLVELHRQGVGLEVMQDRRDIRLALATFDRVLESEELADWRKALREIGEVSLAARSSVEEAVLLGLSGYARKQSPAFNEWPIKQWPFFDFALQLEADFAWRKNDRKLYDILGEDDGAQFVALLAWARNAAAWEEGAQEQAFRWGRLHISRQDVRQFYDNGQDRKGIEAYRAMIGDPSLFRAHDAPSDLFFPHRSLREGRYAAVLLGVLGWAGLFLAFAPWRSATAIMLLPGVLPLPTRVPAHLPTLATLVPIVLGVWIMLGNTPVATFLGKEEPPVSYGQGMSRMSDAPWDSKAFFAFPLWAAARGLYGWAVVGFTAWAAVIFQMIRYPEVLQDVQPDGGFIGAVWLLIALHLAAGQWGQRWLVHKLVRARRTADRLGVVDPAERARFMWRHGTRRRFTR